MLCKIKDTFEYVIASKDNAEYILDKIGFGKDYCLKTYNKDKRYGLASDTEIQYGFENKMCGKIPYGHYIIFDYYFNYDLGYSIFTKKDFEEQFEIVNEI